MAKGGSQQPQGQGLSGRVTPPPPAPPPAWGGSGAPGQRAAVIPGQGRAVKGDPGSAIVSGFRQPPPVAPQPASDGGDDFLRSQLAMALAQQQQHGGGNAGFNSGDRGFSRSPAAQQWRLAMYGAPPYRT